jgi:hypothetical protein
MLCASLIMVFLTLICVCVCICLVASRGSGVEAFAPYPLLIYSVSMTKTLVYLVAPDVLHGLMGTLSHNPHFKVTSQKKEHQDKAIYFDDMFTFIEMAKTSTRKIEALCIVKRVAKHFYITKKADRRPNEKLKNAIDGIIKVGSETEKQLLYHVANACSIPIKDLNVTQTEHDEAYCTTNFGFLGIDQVVSSDPVDFIDFMTDANIHILKAHVPFSTAPNISMDIHYPYVANSKFPTQTTLAFRVVAWCYKDSDIPKDMIHAVVADIGDFDDTNYLALFHPLNTHTWSLLRTKNKYIKNRANLKIIEQFVGNKVDVEAKSNVDGFYNAEERTLDLGDKKSVEEIPTKMIRRVVLRKQDRSEENGLYIISTGGVLEKIQDFATNEEVPEHICVGDPTIMNKGQCNSKYDFKGRPKRFQHVWDRPCKTNDECPFYQANKTYRNYRGGCNNGYCELPIGVTRVGFRGSKGDPICHRCPVENVRCCNLQTNPDYAFELDYGERNLLA